MQEKIDKIIKYWFGDPKGDLDAKGLAAQRSLWWQKDPAVDAKIRELFAADIQAAVAGDYEAWRKSAYGCLALVLLCDQFSRHVYRDTAKAFAQDALAMDVVLQAISQELDQQLPGICRSFFYMPLMHAEEAQVQQQSIAMYEKLWQQDTSELRDYFAGNLKFAKKHKDIIDKFGRYPHRNVFLGRASTPEEEAFLTQPGSSF